MTNSGHELARAPRTNDGSLHLCIARDINHRSETAGNQGGVVVRGIDLRRNLRLQFSLRNALLLKKFF